jgi:hypothetical protein
MVSKLVPCATRPPGLRPERADTGTRLRVPLRRRLRNAALLASLVAGAYLHRWTRSRAR